MLKSVRLIPLRGPIVGNDEIVIENGRTIRIGRGGDADYPIPTDQQISTLHLSLTVNDEGLTALDLNSTNGTFVNERRIQRKLLDHGDELRLGQSIWQVVVAQAQLTPSDFHYTPQGGHGFYSEQHVDNYNNRSNNRPQQNGASEAGDLELRTKDQSFFSQALGTSKLWSNRCGDATVSRPTDVILPFSSLLPRWGMAS